VARHYKMRAEKSGAIYLKIANTHPRPDLIQLEISTAMTEDEEKGLTMKILS